MRRYRKKNLTQKGLLLEKLKLIKPNKLGDTYHFYDKYLPCLDGINSKSMAIMIGSSRAVERLLFRDYKLKVSPKVYGIVCGREIYDGGYGSYVWDLCDDVYYIKNTRITLFHPWL